MSLFISQHFVSVPLVIRGLIEISAASYAIDKRLPDSYLSEEKYDEFSDFALKLLAGSRLKKTVLDFKPPDLISVLNFIDDLEKDNIHPHGRSAYDVMSEFCHPNYAAPGHFFVEDYYYKKGIAAPSDQYKTVLNFYLACSLHSIDIIKNTSHSMYFSIEDYLMKSIKREE